MFPTLRIKSNASRDYSRGLLTSYGGLMSGASQRGAFMQWQAMSEMGHINGPSRRVRDMSATRFIQRRFKWCLT
jgi:hypothetical protein